MSGRVSPVSSMASHDQSAPETEQSDSHRRSRPPTQPGPQQPWYPPNYYHQYPGTAQYPINNFAPYPPVAAHNVPAQARWRVFDLFDEEEQERRNRGKELVPTRHSMSGPPPPWAYSGGYGPGAYAPLEASMWPALPPSQPAPLPLIPLPLPDDSGYPPRKPVKHVRHQGQLPEASLRQRYRSQQLDNKIIRDVDGILTPSSGDLTVHLTMDTEEDLEDRLDEMSRLSRLGDFASARKYFQEHLHHHIDNPYVLVHYADLLLHQGDFKAVTLLKDDVMYKDEGEQSNSEELRILRVNWELLLLLAKSKTLDTLSGADTIFEEAVNVLTAMAKDPSPDRPISSTEIEILALTIQLTGHPVLNSKWLRYGARAIAASSSTFSRLYQTLLRQGRIWDFHDIVVLLPTMEDIKALTYDIFHKDLIPSLKAMVSDWSDSVHGYDTSTTLGLLSILTHILLEPVEASEKECIEILKLCLPLALSVTKNDPSSLKSRSYLRVLLAKSRFAETASRQAIDTLATQLQSAQGVFYQPDIASLPIYVPSGNETPRWTTTDQPAELKAPIGLVLRGAIEMGDLKTEVLTRQELIRLSGDPREEFNKLCDLQLARQGNLNDYGLSLASKYLVSNTKTAKEELAISISRLLSRTASTDYWDASHEWILNMLLYKLEGRSHSTIKHMLERSHTDYHNMERSLLREISRKMPSLKDWVDQQTENSTQTKIQDTVLRAGSGSRRSTKHVSRRARSSATARTVEQPPTRERQSPAGERKEERDIHIIARSKPDNSGRDHDLVPGDRPPHIHPINNGQQNAVDQPRTSQETPVITIRGPNSDVQEARAPLHGDELVVRNLSASESRQNDAKLATQIREKLEAEFDKKLEAEKESEQERRNERMIILEGLKKEVEAIRREAVEQAEKKARIEDQERAERIRWETRQESVLEKEMALAKSEAAAAELAAREMAIKEAERRMREEYEIRKRKEDEARKRAEFEIAKRIEAEKRAYEEAKAAEKLRKELQRKAEIEMREKQEAEKRAREAAIRQAEEETRQWAAERAEREVENQNQIHFKDAIGRKFAIPFSQARTWQGMRELIESAFAHIDIVGPEVQEGHYDLVGPDGSIILPQTWDEIIQPGWNITMQMWPMLAPDASQTLGALPSMSGANAEPSDLARPPPPEEAVLDNLSSAVPIDDDASSGSGSSIGSSWQPSRRLRIAWALSALKSRIFHRRRRASSVTTSTASSRLAREIVD